MEQARSTVESDWQEAEKLAREALDLNPGHPMAKTIRTLILDQKREDFHRRMCFAGAQAAERRPIWRALSRGSKRDWRSIRASRGWFSFRRPCSATCRPSAARPAAAIWKNCAAWRVKSMPRRMPRRSRRWLDECGRVAEKYPNDARNLIHREWHSASLGTAGGEPEHFDRVAPPTSESATLTFHARQSTADPAIARAKRTVQRRRRLRTRLR